MTSELVARAPRAARVTSVAAIPLALVLALTGCAPPDGADTAYTRPDFPLAELVDTLYTGGLSAEEQEARWAADEREREELIGQCMTEQGFEYRPNDGNSFSADSDADYRPEDRDWVSQYGYGAVNNPWMDDMPAEGDHADPNADYLASLSEAEQLAWSDTMWGTSSSAEDDPSDYSWETVGCYRFAEHEVKGDDPTMADEHQPLFDAVERFYDDLAQAPEVAELDAAWASCMDGAGHPGFRSQFDAKNSIFEKSNAITSDGTVDSSEWESRLAPVAEEEIELALADLECREETGYRAQYDSIQIKLERQFIDDNRAAFDALLNDVEQGG